MNSNNKETKQEIVSEVKLNGTSQKKKTAFKKPAKKESNAADMKTEEPAVIKTIAKKIKPAETAVKKTAAAGKKPASKNPIAEKEKTVKKPAVEKIAAKKETPSSAVTLMLRFRTSFGQMLYITGNHPLFGDNDISKALPMQYLSNEVWTATIHLTGDDIPAEGIVYNYIMRYEDGNTTFDWGSDKLLTAELLSSEETMIVDAWNHAGYFENAFYSEPFKHVLLKSSYTPVTVKPLKKYSHTFKIKAPLLQKGHTLCLLGSCEELGNWNEQQAVVMARNESSDFFSVQLDLSKTAFPFQYKYGVYDTERKSFVRYEDGANRGLYDAFVKNKKTIINDGFAVLPNNFWKGAGVAIPVFSLRSHNSCGVGEFADIKLLVDWAKKVGMKLIQILPTNDTTATKTWTDSYPYAAISAFALHPMFLNLEAATEEANKKLLKQIASKKQSLNKLAAIDYEAVNELKWNYIQQIYPLQKDALFASELYKEYFAQNKHWLLPYSIFCYLRDKYKTADFSKWASHQQYEENYAEELLNDTTIFNDIAIHFFVQYHLHVQLKQATQYAHDNGIIVKGDIPIGVYRNGVDAWQNPELYHMDMQAGAPPDDFAVTGQNWGFPTYNWEKMRENHYAWWKQRFEQMSYYFDAFRIDHILGFFRIWCIPSYQVEGIMGHFEPAITIHINEFSERNIWFDYNRYCKPFITDQVLYDIAGDQKDYIVNTFLDYDGYQNYTLRAEFATQQQVENYFSHLEDNEHNRWLKSKLFTLISNVILFEAEGSHGKQFHFRFGIDSTSSFQHLDSGTQHRLKELYIDYYFRRQDNFWMHKAMEKLPALKRETNMLVCGEDLGLVPACVPDVMKQLGILSLEIQRMPKDSTREFFHPADAPYMSVVTPSTHDMSTIRGWWEEDRSRTQRFYNNELGEWGDAPFFCDDWVCKQIIMQHLYSPAMWSIFQLQDILSFSNTVRRENPHEERINVPANPKHYWRYRMHLSLEDLLRSDNYNLELLGYMQSCGRA